MEKKNNPKHISCIAAYKITDVGKKIPCVYMWNDGFKELIDLTDIVNLMDDGKDVVGRQIIGRGNLYLYLYIFYLIYIKIDRLFI